MTLLGWLDHPVADHGVRTLHGRDEWTYVGYPELAGRVRTFAAELAGRGVRGGDVVLIVYRNGPDFITAFFGTLAAGATPSVIAPPIVFEDMASYQSHLSRVLGLARPRMAVVEDDLRSRLSGPLDSHGVPVFDRGGPVAEPGGERGRLALLQFTSGSSSPPKGVEVSWDALEAQLATISSWLCWGPGQSSATWLPIHHDMGLVGMVLTSVTYQSDTWLMRPERFIRRPADWLRCLSTRGVYMTSAPPFALRHTLQRVRPADLEGCDFSSIGAFVVGAEPIDGEALDRFAALLAPYGLSREALIPAYGLAEATLAVTGKPVGAPIEDVLVDRARLRMGEKVVAEPGHGADVLRIVGCGYPLENVRVSVCDEAGELPPGVLGEIVVAGASLADGYRDAARFPASGFRTGDAGFVWDGRLHVLGRLGDALKVRGVQVFAEDLEAALARIEALKPQRYVVVLGAVDGRDTAAAVVEAKPGEWAEEAYRVLRYALADARVLVVAAERGSVRRTTSGKPKRRVIFEDLMAGAVEGTVLYDSAESGKGQA